MSNSVVVFKKVGLLFYQTMVIYRQSDGVGSIFCTKTVRKNIDNENLMCLSGKAGPSHCHKKRNYKCVRPLILNIRQHSLQVTKKGSKDK